MPENMFIRNGIWWARASVNGRDVKRSLRTGSKSEARVRIKSWLAQVDEYKFYGHNAPTYMEAVIRFKKEYLSSSVKPTTAKRYLVSLRQLGPFFAEKKLAQISQRDIGNYISQRSKEGVTNATIKRDVTTLSRMLACCQAWGLIEKNVAKDFDRSVIKERRDPISPPSGDDVELLVSNCPYMFGRIIKALELTGMRQEEAVGLERKRVDLKAGTITLIKTKTSSPRTIRLSPDALELFKSLPVTLEGPYVFWHGQGQRYHNFASMFARIRSKLKLTFRCHDLRHKFAIDWLRAGGDIYQLKLHMGHSSIRTTEIYLGYAARRMEHKAEHVERFAEKSSI